jgi:hypothetical protein
MARLVGCNTALEAKVVEVTNDENLDDPKIAMSGVFYSDVHVHVFP